MIFWVWVTYKHIVQEFGVRNVVQFVLDAKTCEKYMYKILNGWPQMDEKVGTSSDMMGTVPYVQFRWILQDRFS